MENPSYAYLHCDSLDMATLTPIILRVKSPHIEMHEQLLQKCMFVRVNFFGIESKSKRGFGKKDIHVVIIIESTTIVSTTIVSSIFAFQPKLVPMFFHVDFIRNSKCYSKLEVYNHCCHCHWCKGNKGYQKRKPIVDYRWRR